MLTIVHNPAAARRLGDVLIENLDSAIWTSFRAAIAFAKRSGTKHIAPSLATFARRASVKISVGIDHCGTSFEALEDLLKAVRPKGTLWVFHNEAARRPTFHPKVYLFANSTVAECLIGSGNLTEGGLFTNYEAFVHFRLNKESAPDRELLIQIENLLDLWTETNDGTALKVNRSLVTKLRARGDLPSEEEINRAKVATNRIIRGGVFKPRRKIFASVPIPPPPRAQAKHGRRTVVAPIFMGGFPSNGFVITLQRTDVGIGQTSQDTARRSPELFLPKRCVVANNIFWGWPKLFKPDANWKGKIDRDGFGKMDRTGVRMRLGTSILLVNWWYNPNKIDFRMRNEALRGAGNIGDILKIEPGVPKDGYDYYVEIIPKGTSQHEEFEARCTERVPNSLKRYGYY